MGVDLDNVDKEMKKQYTTTIIVLRYTNENRIGENL